MNQIVSRETSFSPCLPAQAASHVAGMFATMLSANGGPFSQAMAAAYIEALSGLPEWAIAEACADYRTGRRGEGKFVPLPGELAKATRSIVDKARERETNRAKLAQQVAELARHRDMLAGRTEDSRARVRAEHERWKRYHAELMAERERERGKGRPVIEEINARTHERFDAEARQSLEKTMLRWEGEETEFAKRNWE